MKLHFYNRLYNKSVKNFWIISCVGLCLMPIIIGIFIYRFSLSNFHKQTVQNNEAMLMQIHDLTDAAFNDVRNIAYSISADNNLAYYLSSYGTQKETATKLKLLEWLKNSRNSSPYIEEIQIYFPDTDEIITDRTTAPLNLAYYSTYRFTWPDCDTLRQAFLSVSGQDTTLVRSESGASSLLFMWNVPKVLNAAADPVILILLDSSVMNRMIANVETGTSCELNFLLQDGQYLYPESDALNRFAAVSSSLGTTRSLQNIALKNGDTISCISSQYFGLSYVLRTPDSATIYEMIQISRYFLAGLLILLLGGALLTGNFIKANYRPIRELLTIAAESGFIPSEASRPESAAEPVPGRSRRTSACGAPRNEYTLLKEAFHSSRHRNQNMELLLSSREEELKKSMIALLIQNSGRAADKPEFQDYLKRYFPYDTFCTAIFLLDSVNSDDLPALSAEEAENALLAARKEPDIFGESEPHICLTKDTGRVILVFNVPDSGKDSWNQKLHSFISCFTTKLVQNRPGLKDKILCSLSPLHSGIGEISMACQEADYALRYRLIFGSDFTPEDTAYTPALPVTQSFYYPEEEESRLFGAILNGDGEQAESIFHDLWYLNTGKYNIASEYLYYLLSDITGTVIRTGNLVPLAHAVSEHILAVSRTMMQESSIPELKKNLLLLIREVSAAYEEEHARSSDKLKQKVYEYIEQNYANPDLSVESVSDAFGKSRTSLFQLFKDETGNSLLYHINKVRIDRAQELLKATEKSIAEIAEETGFHSSINFTRVFKKYTSLTPSRYRELNGNKQ